jgi:pyruvate/2-oxoglutarate dehydrogenase complex dihydrolipoamide acyltransferase (E2) component
MPPNRRLPTGRSHRVERLSVGRLRVIRLLISVAGRHTVHGLVEVDVTAALQRLRAPGSGTVTALVVAAVAAAVREHPQVNSRRAGRKLVVFDDIDVIVTVERTPTGGATAPVPLVVQRADQKSETEIAAELRAGKGKSAPSGDGSHALVSRLPFWLVRAGVSAVGSVPRMAAALGPPIGVSSLGMFASGWAIPISPLTVMVTVGGIAQRPALVDGKLVERDILPLTLSFDHTVVDGGPAARFAATLVSILQGADRWVDGPDR